MPVEAPMEANYDSVMYEPTPYQLVCEIDAFRRQHRAEYKRRRVRWADFRFLGGHNECNPYCSECFNLVRILLAVLTR